MQQAVETGTSSSRGGGVAEGDKASKRGRVVFISASFLVKFYRSVPEEVMRDAIFFFGSKRSWMFPKSDAERLESQRQPTNYLKFPRDFLDLIRAKEDAGLVYYLKPDEDYRKVSAFFEGIIDPVTGEHYKPLILDNNWWRKEYRPATSKNRPPPSGERVILNYLEGAHDYYPTMELLSQSNPTLQPVLQWQ
jgi:hypothetical protein